jgi:hypothetical protein
VTVTRARYLCDLAITGNTPPPMVDQLTVADFVILVEGLDAYRKAIERAQKEG